MNPRIQISPTVGHGKPVICGTRVLVSPKSSLQPNPTEPAELAMQHATEAERDAAVGPFVRKLFETHPEASLVWSASRSDEGNRSHRLVELYIRRLEKEPEAAQHWRETSPDLPENSRAELAEKVP